MNKVLVISPSWLGDLIMSQSLLKTLKQLNPGISIDVYAPGYTHPIVSRMPEVDRFIENPFAHGELNLIKRYKEGKNLAKNNYDCIFVLPNSLKSALIAFFAGASDRRGFKGESRYILLNNMRCNKQDFPRMVERYVALAYDKNDVKTALDLPAFEYPKLTIKSLSPDLLAKLNIPEQHRPFLGIGCGANYGPSKLWPVEYFAKACDYWIERGGAVLGLGTKKDSETVKAIQGLIHKDNSDYFYDISGKTSLAEALDLCGSCQAAICNDSGMMHTMAAADVPQVCIFGSTSTTYTPPLSDKAVCVESTQPCHPCFARTCRFNTYACLKEISPETVIEKLAAIIKAIKCF